MPAPPHFLYEALISQTHCIQLSLQELNLTALTYSEFNCTIFPPEYEEAENQHKVVIAVAAAVPCACCLIFIIVLTVLKRAHKRCAE